MPKKLYDLTNPDEIVALNLRVIGDCLLELKERIEKLEERMKDLEQLEADLQNFMVK